MAGKNDVVSIRVPYRNLKDAEVEMMGIDDGAHHQIDLNSSATSSSSFSKGSGSGGGRGYQSSLTSESVVAPNQNTLMMLILSSREKLSGPVEEFSRRNGSGLPGDNSRHRSVGDAPSSKYVLRDSERTRNLSRNGSASKRPVISSSRPSSSGEPGDGRSSRLVSSSGRLSTTQRTPGYESKVSYTRTSAARGSRDDALRSFEFLSIGTGKRK